MPKRHSPLTKKMALNLLKFCKDFPQDWCIIGLHVGYRCCQWAADKAPKHPIHFPQADNPQLSIYQVLCNGIQVSGTASGKRVLDVLAYPAPWLQIVKIRVHFQKNATDNGQDLTEALNHVDPQLCCTRAAQRVKQ
jgi:hypothetical protein